MKKIVILFAFALLFANCQKNKDVFTELKSKELAPEAFFTKVVSLSADAIENQKVLLLSYQWNAENKTIQLTEAVEKEPSWGLAFEVAELKRAKENRSKTLYKVKCEKADGSWEKICDGKYSCGVTVYSCLEQGGCAKICKANMVYEPQTKTFFLSDDLGKFIEPEQ